VTRQTTAAPAGSPTLESHALLELSCWCVCRLQLRHTMVRQHLQHGHLQATSNKMASPRPHLPTFWHHTAACCSGCWQQPMAVELPLLQAPSISQPLQQNVTAGRVPNMQHLQAPQPYQCRSQVITRCCLQPRQVQGNELQQQTITPLSGRCLGCCSTGSYWNSSAGQLAASSCATMHRPATHKHVLQ